MGRIYDWFHDYDPDAVARRNARRASRPGGCGMMLGIVLIVLLTLAAVRVAGNEMSKGSPPASCQLLGGQWTLWSGWHCG